MIQWRQVSVINNCSKSHKYICLEKANHWDGNGNSFQLGDSGSFNLKIIIITFLNSDVIIIIKWQIVWIKGKQTGHVMPIPYWSSFAYLSDPSWIPSESCLSFIAVCAPFPKAQPSSTATSQTQMSTGGKISRRRASLLISSGCLGNLMIWKKLWNCNKT